MIVEDPPFETFELLLAEFVEALLVFKLDLELLGDGIIEFGDRLGRPVVVADPGVLNKLD